VVTHLPVPLGEVVECDFEVASGATIEVGQPIGCVEGFKAVTELYAPLAGRFATANPNLDDEIDAIHRFPYDRGWLYRVEGQPPTDAMTPTEYARFLDETIDRMTGRDA